MKKLILSTLFLSANVFAQSSLTDIMYLPAQGTVYGKSALGVGFGKSELKSEATGDKIADVKNLALGVTQTLGYSVANNLFVGAEIGYQRSTTEFDQTGSNTLDLEQNGITDPSLLAKLRIFSNESMLDLLVKADISIGDRKVSDASDEKYGNALSGGHALHAQLQYGKKLGEQQFALNVGLSHYFKADEESDNNSWTSDAHSAISFGGEYQYCLSSEMCLAPYLQIAFVQSYEDSDNSEYEQQSQHTFGVAGKYLLSKSLMAQIDLSYINVENNRVDGMEYEKDFLINAVASVSYEF